MKFIKNPLQWVFVGFSKGFWPVYKTELKKSVLYETPNLGFMRKPFTMGFCKVSGWFTKGF